MKAGLDGSGQYRLADLMVAQDLRVGRIFQKIANSDIRDLEVRLHVDTQPRHETCSHV